MLASFLLVIVMSKSGGMRNTLAVSDSWSGVKWASENVKVGNAKPCGARFWTPRGTLFLSEGYANVSMRKIAEQIEYSPGAIYSYFTSKEDIFFALAEEGLQFVRTHCSAAAHANAPARTCPRGLLAVLYVQQGSSPSIFR